MKKAILFAAFVILTGWVAAQSAPQQADPKQTERKEEEKKTGNKSIAKVSKKQAKKKTTEEKVVLDVSSFIKENEEGTTPEAKKD